MGGSRVNYFGSRSPLGHCFQFLHSGPNLVYASFGYRQSGSPVQGGRPASTAMCSTNTGEEMGLIASSFPP